MKLFPTGCAAAMFSALVLSGCASQAGQIAGDWAPTIAACERMGRLQPMAALPSSAHVLMQVEFEQGRAVRKTLRVLKGIEDRRLQRQAFAEIDRVFGGTSCPGIQRLEAEVVLGPQQAGFRRVKIKP